MDIVKSSAAPAELVFLTTAQIRELIREELNRALTHAPQEERLLAVEEVAKVISVSMNWLYRNSGKLPFTRKLGPKMLCFSHDGIFKWLATRRLTKTETKN